MKNILFINPYPPTHEKIQQILDFILAASVYDQNLSVLFLGEGLFQLTDVPICKNLKALPEFGIHQFYADQASLDELELNPSQLALPLKILSNEELAQFIVQQDLIL